MADKRLEEATAQIDTALEELTTILLERDTTNEMRRQRLDRWAERTLRRIVNHVSISEWSKAGDGRLRAYQMLYGGWEEPFHLRIDGPIAYLKALKEAIQAEPELVHRETVSVAESMRLYKRYRLFLIAAERFVSTLALIYRVPKSALAWLLSDSLRRTVTTVAGLATIITAMILIL